MSIVIEWRREMRLLIWDADYAEPWESDRELAEAVRDYFAEHLIAGQSVEVIPRPVGVCHGTDVVVWQVVSEAMWGRRKLWNRWCGDHQKVDEYVEGRDYLLLFNFFVDVMDC